MNTESPLPSSVPLSGVPAIVKGYQDFELYNSFGPIDTAGPFQPFGALPDVGCYLELLDPQAFNGFTRNLALHLEWRDLPEGDLSHIMISLSSGGNSQQAPLFNEIIPVNLPFEDSMRSELISPADPFGHNTYATRVAEAIVKGDQAPAMPYVPVPNKIWLNFELA